MARTELEAAATGLGALPRIWEATSARLDLVTALLRASRHAEAAPVLAEARAVAERRAAFPCSAGRTSSVLCQEPGYDRRTVAAADRPGVQVARLVAAG